MANSDWWWLQLVVQSINGVSSVLLTYNWQTTITVWITSSSFDFFWTPGVSASGASASSRTRPAVRWRCCGGVPDTPGFMTLGWDKIWVIGDFYWFTLQCLIINRHIIVHNSPSKCCFVSHDPLYPMIHDWKVYPLKHGMLHLWDVPSKPPFISIYAQISICLKRIIQWLYSQSAPRTGIKMPARCSPVGTETVEKETLETETVETETVEETTLEVGMTPFW